MFRTRCERGQSPEAEGVTPRWAHRSSDWSDFLRRAERSEIPIRKPQRPPKIIHGSTGPICTMEPVPLKTQKGDSKKAAV